MNKIQVKLYWFEIMINSNYGIGESNKAIYDEMIRLKLRSLLIEKRKQKIRNICAILN